MNATDKKERDYMSYYSPDTVAHAKRVFGPFMKEWGYELPPSGTRRTWAWIGCSSMS